MTKKITFVTGNERKFNNCLKNFAGTDIEVVREKVDTTEIQSSEVTEVAKYSALDASKKISKSLFKVDVGFGIESLKGFPGPYIKYINKWLDPQDILNMIQEKNDRKCYFEDVIACHIPGKEIETFSDKTFGTLADSPKGENGWGIDKIFIPEGYEKTLAQISEEEQVEIWGNSRWKNLIEYLKNNL